MIQYYVGIDGGGTSCRARIRDHQGRLLGEAKGGIAERIGDWLAPSTHQWLVTPKYDALEGALMFAGKSEHNFLKERKHELSSPTCRYI